MVSNRNLNALYGQAWPHHREFDFTPVLRQSLDWVCAFAGEELVGFAYLAWDGSQHGFLLEPTVLPGLRKRGIGKEMIQRLIDVARRKGLEWVHVDYDKSLEPFYQSCGFATTAAGLIHLKEKATP